MKKNKRSTLISKPDVMTCWRCKGKGYEEQSLGHCKLCLGSGIWIENHYVIIDNKNKIAIDSDCGA